MTASEGGKNQEGNPSASTHGSSEGERSKQRLSGETIRWRAQLRAVIDSIPDLISVKNRDGVYWLCNRAFSRYVGVEPRLVVGRTDAELFDEEEARRRSELDREVLDGQETLRSESWKESADGGRALFDTLGAPFYSLEGELLGLIAISRDITERHRFEEELRRARDELSEQYEQLKELEALRDSLTHMIVHDLRNPVTGIIAWLKMAQETDPDAPAEESERYVARALWNASMLAQMINGVLDVSKMEAGDMELDIRVHDIAETSRAALDSLGGLIPDRDVEVESDEEVRAAYDEPLVTRVIANLVANALWFTPHDGSVRVVVRKGEDGFARVEVRDTGEGIPAEYHEKIFEKFGRVGQDARQVRLPTGLGLAFCKMVLDAHGGSIGVMSQVEKGSTFWFELPDGS
ncbi:MAG: PAS domain-containing protein [Gemmatimonadetes bacterium]|nr:PAS domain-containing protein [Gemmatimonadota bacterium]